MRQTRVWTKGLGLCGAVVEGVELEAWSNTVVVAVRVGWQDRDQCGLCRQRYPGFDRGRGRRRWRTLDLGSSVAVVEADSPRVNCPEHGVVVAWVPWARHGSRFTRTFEEQAACLTAHSAQSTVATPLPDFPQVGEVMRQVVEGLARWSGGQTWWTVPTKAALFQARRRLGPEPLAALFAAVAQQVGLQITPGVFNRDWRLLSPDGTCLDVADTPANVTSFGRPGASRGNAVGAFPQVRLVGLPSAGPMRFSGWRWGLTHCRSAAWWIA